MVGVNIRKQSSQVNVFRLVDHKPGLVRVNNRGQDGINSNCEEFSKNLQVIIKESNRSE